MNGFTLRALPGSAKIILTGFLALTGTGYLFALAQIYATHQKRDGKEGLSYDDFRATYHGLTVEVSAAEAGKPLPSRILEMIEGDMRKYFKSEQEFQILYDWLAAGAGREAFEAGEKRKTPNDIVRRRCLRFHAFEDGEDIGRESPFGPDIFAADFEMISKFTTAQEPDAPAGTARISPTSPARLIMLTHTHMLAIPIFTLIVGLLFVMTDFPGPFKAPIAIIPMLANIVDFSGWWLVRWCEALLIGILISGAAFGLCFAIQLFWVTGALWVGKRPD